MKTKLIFAVIAVLGALAIYLIKENEILAGSFVLLVWGIYERMTKEEIKTIFSKSNPLEYREYKNKL